FLEDIRQQMPAWLNELDGPFDAAAAQAIVHQWVGSGGLLGFRRISKLAREVETTLRQKPLDVAELREDLEALAQESKEPTLNTASEEPTAPVSPSAGSGVRVLILDADPNLRALAKAFVESQAMECRTAGDGRSALDAVEAFRPHIVVLDLNLPGMG